MKHLFTTLTLLTISTAMAQAQPLDPITGKQTLITISPETTFITEPLDERGYPDYLAYMNREMLKDVTDPRQNAAIYLLAIFGPYTQNSPSRLLADQTCEHLGVPPLPEKDNYFIYTSQHVTRLIKIRKKDAPADEIQAALDVVNRFWPPSAAWTVNDNPVLASYLTLPETQRSLQLLELMSTCNVYHLPYATGTTNHVFTPLNSVPLPYSQQSRELARLLQTQAMLDLGEGRFQQAADRLIQMHKLARFFTSQPFIIDHLIAVAMEAMASQADAQFVRHPTVPTEVLRDFQSQHQSLLPFVDAGRNVTVSIATAERFIHLDTIISLATYTTQPALPFDPPSLILEFESPDLAKRVNFVASAQELDVNLILRKSNQYFDQYSQLDLDDYVKQFQGLQKMYQQLVTAREFSKLQNMEQLLSEMSIEERSHMINQIILANQNFPLIQCFNAETRACTKHDLVQLLIALELYYRDHHTYPETLAPLAPDNIPSIPLDRFTNQPLNYITKNNQFKLYSVGYEPQHAGTYRSGLTFTSRGWVD